MERRHLLFHCFREGQAHDVGLMFVAVRRIHYIALDNPDVVEAYAGPYGDL